MHDIAEKLLIWY